MTKGRRLAVIHQASVTWDDVDLEDFVERGLCGEEAEPVMPFNPGLRTEIVKQFEGA